MSRCRGLLTIAAATACLLFAPAEDAQAAQAPAKPKRAQTDARAPVRDPAHTFERYPKSWMDIRVQNIVMQQYDYSCGAASLATLLQYHWGDKVGEDRILREVITMLTVDELKDRIQKGLTLTDLRRLAVRMGYQSTIGRLEFDKLRESKIPLIVGIVVEKFDHFVVYRGSDGQYVYLADPARGNLRIPVPEFVKQWQKNMVLVVVKPGVDPAGMVTPLTLKADEVFHGELNREFVRDRATTKLLPGY